MKVIRLRGGDEELAEQVLQRFFLEDLRDNHIHNFLISDHNYLLVAVWEGVPVGVLLGYRLERPETQRPKLFVYEMEVLAAQRGRGIGKVLINSFQDIARQVNATEIFLMTNQSNIPAMRLYESTGGVQEGDDNVLFVYDNF
jgi:ribosomal protein S18 acetylase RimI-like enzyme